MSAMPIGMPGWPELAACTASMARKRMALARSRRLGVVMGRASGGARRCAGGTLSHPCPAVSRLKRSDAGASAAPHSFCPSVVRAGHGDKGDDVALAAGPFQFQVQRLPDL